ncbi:MAG TPA: extracellular solute-binding protein [Candidatus Limiplasma sp.]|nr:extracellular solute-binding protein [Candidatus Limiplasma sp.]HRX07711.1 extracellular solute-binding protein [Candidatus Limiplasma sp.]
MKNMKQFIGFALALVLVVTSLGSVAFAAEGKRNITIGLWWDRYYDSTQESVEDNPFYQGTISDQMLFDVVKKVEEKYDVTIEYQNLTYVGIQESINTSVLAGTPDCDIYLVDTPIGVPAVMNGYAINMKDILPADSDIFTDHLVMNYLDLGDGGAYMIKPVSGQSVVEATYPLMFNLQMIQDANLEDPRDLYAKGEWTWDKFAEYCQALTKDTNGDGIIDVYGFGGFQQEWFEAMLMSNGTYVASNGTENFSAPEVTEVLQFMQDMYVKYNCAYPYAAESASDVMRFIYRDGKCAFSPGAAWVLGANADYNWDGSAASTLEFDMVFVQWPVGPSGNQETNKMKLSGGEFYIIPVGVEDPELVYNVFYDFTNWYDNDVSIRDDAQTLGWWYGVTGKDLDIQDWNFSVMFDMGLREQFDLVSSLNVFPDFLGLFNGDYTPAQFQETYKQEYQDALDRTFK